MAHKAIAKYRGTPFEQPLRVAYRKLNAQLNNQSRYWLQNLGEGLSFRPFGPEDTDLEGFEQLTKAVMRRRELKFNYRKLAARKWEDRHVRPYHVACVDNHWYMLGYDLKRQDIRTFAISRMRQVLMTPKRFKLPANFGVDDYLRGSFGIFKGYEDYEVVVDFDAWATDLIRGRQWHEGQDFMELPGHGARLRLRLNSLEEFTGWVLNWGPHATVVRPKALVARVRKAAREILERYPEAADAPAS